MDDRYRFLGALYIWNLRCLYYQDRQAVTQRTEYGGWLLAVVATEAVAQLTLIILPNFPDRYEPMLFLSLVLWLCGGMLYIWMISLIFYHTFFIFSPFRPSAILLD